MSTPARPAFPAVATDAPVFATARSEIAAPAEEVWAVLTAIDEWPSWNPDVRSSSLSGSLVRGSTFSWKAGPGTITSTIEHVEPPRLIAWTGKTLGIKATHVWRLEPHDGHTRVETEESYEGLVARILRRWLQKTLERALRDGVMHLKSAVEGAPRPSAAHERGTCSETTG